MLRRVVNVCARDNFRLLVLSESRRFAQPTFSEISESLAVLGVDINCDEKELKKKYRELVRKHHPDAGGNEATMSKITVSYDRITSLSKRDKEEFQVQKNAYRGGRGNFGGQPSTSQAYRTYAGQSKSSDSSSYGPEYADRQESHTWSQGPNFSRAYANANARATYNYNRGTAYSENPFRGNPFDMRKQAQHYARMPFGRFIVRAVAAYFGLSLLFLLVYRRYSDWRQDDGWKASESLARHEQLEELHRIRRELNEKMTSARDTKNAQRAADFERSKELRVLEYTQRRVMEQQEEEFASWPRFDESKGKLTKKPFDPPGITYFEPGVENEKRRQLSAAFGESSAERLAREEAVMRADRRIRNVLDVPTAENGNSSHATTPGRGVEEVSTAIRGLLNTNGS